MTEKKIAKIAMKFKVALASVSLILGVSVFVAPSSRADSLEVLGGVVTWPDKMYLPDGCSNFSFQYKNNTGVRLLQLGFIIIDPFGRKVEDDSEIGIEPNKSGTWNRQICSHDFKNGLGPYVMKVFVEDYSSTQRETTKEIFFVAIPGTGTGGTSGLNPTPAPTVTVTARPAPAPTVTLDPEPTLLARIMVLESELNTTKAKLKKVCAVKPKPKFC
jgi:hypothetical protein